MEFGNFVVLIGGVFFKKKNSGKERGMMDGKRNG